MDMTLLYLSNWGKKLIYFPTDSQWLYESKRVHEDPKYNHYKSILFFFVDGSVI
jgi:hypothetical protein